MDEARRFLRYVLPGLVILLQIVFILFLNGDLEQLNHYTDFGTAVIAFLTSGIIGFLFSNLYYIIHWEFYLPSKALSKLDFIRVIQENKELFKDHQENEPRSQREAWPILNVFFTMNYGEKLQYFERKTESISNILAGIGTTTVIIICGLFVGSFFLDNLKAIIIYSLCNILIIGILLWNYQLAANILQNLYLRAIEWIKNHPKENKGN